MKRPGEMNHREAAEADQSTRGGREATGPEDEGQRPTPTLARGIHTKSSPEAKTTECGTPPPPPLQSRPANLRMTQRHPEDGRKKRSQEPNCSNSFTRDQIVRSRPDRGDPILKEKAYRPDIQRRLRYDRVGENSHSTRKVTPSRSN